MRISRDTVNPPNNTVAAEKIPNSNIGCPTSAIVPPLKNTMCAISTIHVRGKIRLSD